MKMNTRFIICFIILSMILTGNALSSSESRKRVLYVNSYHDGYAWSDGIRVGVEQTLKPRVLKKEVELKMIAMDTKRHRSEAFIKESATRVKAFIESWQPDVVIASDDNASKYVIAPNYKDQKIPFVFCGVNWDASAYGFPFRNTTGMIEVSLIPQLLEKMKKYAKGDRIGLLGADNLSNRKEAQNYKNKFGLQLEKEVFVNSFNELQSAFMDMQHEVDMIILAPPSFLKTIEEQKDARVFFEAHTTVPTGCVEDWITPFTLMGYTKLAREQGEWAAMAAMRILDGTPPSSITMVTNKKAKVYLNMRLAKKMGILFPIELVSTATFVE